MLASVHVPDVAAREMRASERPLWICKPNAKKVAIEDGGPWFGIGLLIAATVIGAQISNPENSAGLLAFMLAIAAWPMSSPLRIYMRERHTLYLITNQRLLILNRSKTQCYDLKNIGSVSFHSGRDRGTGSVLFSEEPIRDDDGNLTMRRVGFRHVPNPRETGALIERAKEQALAPQSDRSD